ncbi:MAG: hypothetical protein M1834_006941 [Cirrosporium novae-zelandiae]|nr:MAG: hypothetical protein M1834_006941 [Cirrosporium novae-zelandiae]
MSLPQPPDYPSLPLTQLNLSHPDISPKILILTLARPHHHNAFTSKMGEEIEFVFGLVDRDPRIRCVVMRGWGGRDFCAGADLELGFPIEEGGEALRAHRDGGGRVALAIHRCRTPTIAAITGNAVGIGITMTLPCTIRVVRASANIGFVFSRRGLVMEACSSYFLPRLIGMSRALQVCTTGATYEGRDPVWGDLFGAVVEGGAEDVVARALEVAQEVVDNTSPISTYLMREMMWRDKGSAEAQHLLDSRVIGELFRGRDMKEGISSFFEKRKPEFKGNMEEDAPAVFPWWDPVDTRAPNEKGIEGEKSKL